LSLFTSWWYRFLTGCYRAKTFDAFLEKLASQVFQGMQLSTLEREIWNNPEIQQYYRYVQKHSWTAHGAQGVGRIKLGFLTRGQAMQEFGKVSPQSVVLHIDDTYHFLFYKPKE